MTPDEHAFVGNASEGIARLISSIDSRPGQSSSLQQR